MFDFKPSKKLTNTLARESSTIQEISRYSNIGIIESLFFWKRHDLEKARDFIGTTLGNAIVGLATREKLNGKGPRIFLNGLAGNFWKDLGSRILLQFNLPATDRTRLFLFMLGQELCDWLRSKKNGLVEMDSKCVVAELSAWNDDGHILIKFREDVSLDSWATLVSENQVVSEE